MLRKKQLSLIAIPYAKYVCMCKTSFDDNASLEPFNECVCHGMLNLEMGACLNLTADLFKG